MTKDQAIRLAVKAVRKSAVEYYGWSAKYHPEDRKVWDEHMEAIRILQSLMDKKPTEKE